MPPAAKHRETLIATAMSLFRKQGYTGTGLAEILSESGAPKGSLYHYFPDGKEAVGEAALHLATEEGGRFLRAMMTAIDDPALLLRTYAAGAAEALSSSGFRDGCPIATIALEAAPSSNRLCTAAEQAFGRWSGALARYLGRVGFPPDRAAELADFIIASFEGSLILARVRQDTTAITRAADEVARLIDAELKTLRSVQ